MMRMHTQYKIGIAELSYSFNAKLASVKWIVLHLRARNLSKWNKIRTFERKNAQIEMISIVSHRIEIGWVRHSVTQHWIRNCKSYFLFRCSPFYHTLMDEVEKKWAAALCDRCPNLIADFLFRFILVSIIAYIKILPKYLQSNI